MSIPHHVLLLASCNYKFLIEDIFRYRSINVGWVDAAVGSIPYRLREMLMQSCLRLLAVGFLHREHHSRFSQEDGKCLRVDSRLSLQDAYSELPEPLVQCLLRSPAQRAVSFCLVSFGLVLRRLICLVLSWCCVVLSCFDLSFLVLSCIVFSSHVLPCVLMPFFREQENSVEFWRSLW